MKNGFLIVTIITFCLTVISASAQVSNKNNYKIRSKNGNLVVTFERKSHLLNVSDKIDAAKITETEILFVNRKANFTYLVVDVSGQSREKENDRQCGAGTEANLLWIKLDANWKISDVNSVRYESCWSSTLSDESYKIDANHLEIEIDNIRDKLKTKVFYNADEPEKGFQIEQTPLEISE